MKKIAILQSNYIPWKGYFDIIGSVDEFILYDDMQYTKRDWRNRNIIKTIDGLKWLTIPVDTKGKYYQKINETRISDSSWVDKHWRTLQYNYGKSEFYDYYADTIKEIYESCRGEEFLSRVNYKFLTGICKILGITTKITFSSDYHLVEGKTERLVALVRLAGGDYYLSGPAAKAYIDPRLFEQCGIELDWMDYSGYPEYKQIGNGFEHGVSILDMLFCVGPKTSEYMKFTQRDKMAN